MSLPEYKIWSQQKFITIVKNGWLFIVNGILLLLLLIQQFQNQQPRLVLIPFHGSSLNLDQQQLNPSYLKQLALSLAILLGNVHPGNLDYLQQNLSSYVSSNFYQELQATLEQQSQRIKQQQLSLSFTPESLELLDNNQVAVKGVAITTTIDGIRLQQKLTYKMSFINSNYLVQLDQLTLEEHPY